ncbi:hypothetical protein ACE1CI_12085 [Aerosakkonemataceae cyanobacterium BLCC-F50]|uniref:Uncharacterized protein n=1 Tax=Floridaenema flaviceps BLCC-F50 TaxID=3153642 RepID=A0ABV4XRC2_9CYAN
MLDVIIQNGLIFDGLGSAPMRGDLGIENGKIVAIAPSIPANAHQVEESEGLHNSYSTHQEAMKSYKVYVEKLDYLWKRNREMSLMTFMGDIPAAKADEQEMLDTLVPNVPNRCEIAD